MFTWFKKLMIKEEETMKTPTNWGHKSVVKNLAERQLGIENTKNLSYNKTLSTIQNLKPTFGLENSPFIGISNQISEIQFNPKGTSVASVLWGNDKVQVWNLSNHKLQAFFESGHGFTVRQVRWVPNFDNLVLTSGDSGCIRLMDLNTKTSTSVERFSENTHYYSKSLKMCVHKSLPHSVLAGSVTGVVVHIDIRKTESIEVIRIIEDDLSSYHIDSLDINPMKSSEFCVGSSRNARVYDDRFLKKPVQILKMKHPHDFWCNLYERRSNVNAKYNYNGSEILVAYSEGPIYLFNVNEAQPKKMYLTEKMNPPKPSRFTMYNAHYIGAQSEFVAASTTVYKKRDDVKYASDQQHTLFIWDKETEELMNKIHIREASWRFAVHPHMPVLAFNMDHNGVRLWQ